MRRLFSSIITAYARAICSLQYKMDYTGNTANITMCLPSQPSVFGWASVYLLFLKPFVIVSVLSSPLVRVVVFDRVASR